MGVLAGYATGNLEGQDDYERIPIKLRFSFDGDRPLQRLGFDPPGELSLNLEPFFTQTVSPENRIEVGAQLFLRWGFGLGESPLGVYVEAGTGPMYMTQDTREQSTHVNFISEAGAGVTWALSDGWCAEAGYRLWHISNAGIDHPNSGIDGHSVHVGVMRLF